MNARSRRPRRLASRGLWAALVVGLLPSCEAAAPRVTRAFVLSEIQISLEESPEGIVGLDLDGVVSDGTDESAPAGGCVHTDLVGTDGTEGVDGQLATLGSVIALFGFGDINATLQQTINEGSLVMLIEMEGPPDLGTDGSVRAVAIRGVGPLDLGTDGRAEPGQSFDPVGEPALTGRGAVRDGELELSLEGEIVVPLRFVMTTGDVRLRDLRVRVREESPGAYVGTMGATVDVADVEALVAQAVADGGGTGGASFLSLLHRVLTGAADVERDEATQACQGITAGFAIGAVDAFILW